MPGPNTRAVPNGVVLRYFAAALAVRTVRISLLDQVELRRFELLTPCMPSGGSTSTCVHRPSPQVTVPVSARQSPGIRTRCGTSLLYSPTGRWRSGASPAAACLSISSRAFPPPLPPEKAFWCTERFSSGGLAGLKDVDGLGELPGAPGAAAEFAQDPPGLELGVRPLAGSAEPRVGPVGFCEAGLPRPR